MDNALADTFRRILCNARAARGINERGLAPDPANPARNKVVDEKAFAGWVSAAARKARADITSFGFSDSYDVRAERTTAGLGVQLTVYVDGASAVEVVF